MRWRARRKKVPRGGAEEDSGDPLGILPRQAARECFAEAELGAAKRHLPLPPRRPLTIGIAYPRRQVSVPYANILQAARQHIAALQHLGIKYGLPVMGLSRTDVIVRLLRALLQFCERFACGFGDPARRIVPLTTSS